MDGLFVRYRRIVSLRPELHELSRETSHDLRVVEAFSDGLILSAKSIYGFFRESQKILAIFTTYSFHKKSPYNGGRFGICSIGNQRSRRSSATHLRYSMIGVPPTVRAMCLHRRGTEYALIVHSMISFRDIIGSVWIAVSIRKKKRSKIRGQEKNITIFERMQILSYFISSLQKFACGLSQSIPRFIISTPDFFRISSIVSHSTPSVSSTPFGYVKCKMKRIYKKLKNYFP